MRQCKICGKASKIVWSRHLLRGKYNPTSRSRKYPNLQKTKLTSGKKVLACTRCIRNLGKNGK